MSVEMESLFPEVLKAIDVLSGTNLLRMGSAAQKEALSVLGDIRVFDSLKEYTPCLAGTYPLDLQVETSDLDVLLYSSDLESLAGVLRSRFRRFEAFREYSRWIRGRMSLVVQFRCSGFPVEIFAQDIPVRKQDGFVHLLAEYRLLSLSDEGFKDAVLEKKRQGMKTEPAFGAILGIMDDPYSFLLELAFKPDKFLSDLLGNSRPGPVFFD